MVDVWWYRNEKEFTSQWMWWCRVIIEEFSLTLPRVVSIYRIRHVDIYQAISLRSFWCWLYVILPTVWKPQIFVAKCFENQVAVCLWKELWEMDASFCPLSFFQPQKCGRADLPLEGQGASSFRGVIDAASWEDCKGGRFGSQHSFHLFCKSIQKAWTKSNWLLFKLRNIKSEDAIILKCTHMQCRLISLAIPHGLVVYRLPELHCQIQKNHVATVVKAKTLSDPNK